MLITDAWGEPVELDELDGAGLLSVVGGQALRSRGVERDKLLAAHQWCVLHPATPETGVDSWGEGAGVTVLPGVLTAPETLGGDGTPAVAAFTVEPFATTLGVSVQAAMKLLADALDLHHRLPRCWQRVMALEVEAWRARKVAELTRPLTRVAAAEVDRTIARVLHSCSGPAIERAVAHAIAVHQPELLAEKTQRDQDSWDVTLGRNTPEEFTGTSWLQATGDTLDLTAFYDRVTDIAADLEAAGDTDSLGARKAKALGVLARQGIAGAEADLLALIGQDATQPAPPAQRRKPKTHLYLHASLTDLLGLRPDHAVGPDGGSIACGDVERLGSVLLETIRGWVEGSEATITPVLDLDHQWAVDGHDVPPRMREQVILRDRHCVFPHCSRDARACDCDHTIPYVPMDEGGPPGQTNPANLAPLCRRHHRAKTSGRWRYRRQPDGTYLWHGPHGRRYTVTPFGTIAHQPN